MKNKLLGLLTILTLSAIILSLTAWAVASSPNRDSPKQASKTTEAGAAQQEPALEHIPIVDFETSASALTDTDTKARAIRSAKGKRYAKRINGLIADRDVPGGMILTSRYMQPLPSFPVGRSAIIAFGEVVDVQAYLSDDKSGVYSEFSVRIEEVLKNDPLAPSFPGGLVVAERYGGRVRFPSGRVTFFGNRDQGMPRLGGRYIFFLERSDQQYSILTAYELLSGRIHPVDGKNAPSRDSANSVGDAYENADSTRFKNEVQRAISEYSRTPLAKGAVTP